MKQYFYLYVINSIIAFCSQVNKMRVIKPKSIPDQYQQSLYINNSWLADDDLWLGKFSHVTQIQQGCLRVRFYPSVTQRHVESRGSRAVHTCIKRHKKVIDYWELSIDNLGAWPRDIFQSSLLAAIDGSCTLQYYWGWFNWTKKWSGTLLIFMKMVE